MKPFICKIHGELKEDEIKIYKSTTNACGYRRVCHTCSKELARKWKKNNKKKHVDGSTRWKKENRERYKQWARDDRKKYPEKYRIQRIERMKRLGKDIWNQKKVLSAHKLTVDQHNKMISDQQNICAICNKEETRKARVEGITALGIDHCHTCEKYGTYIARGLLCHSCNTGIGKFKDDIELMKKAILYLESHEHIGKEDDS